MAAVLDGVVLSAPVIREPIVAGSGQISSNFTVKSANDLAILMRSGTLPTPLTVIEESVVTGARVKNLDLQPVRIASGFATVVVASRDTKKSR